MKFSIKKVLIESIIIILSVFLGIFLEDKWQQRKRETDAKMLLIQLRNELKQDLIDIDRIINLQEQNGKHYQFLLQSLELMDTKVFFAIDSSLQKIIDNSTLYPRSASWEILISSGLLAEIEDKELSIELMSLYENSNKRILDNADGYDKTLNEMLRVHIPEFWDFVNKRPLSREYKTTSKFRTQIEHIYRDWNKYYIELLRKQKSNGDLLIQQIDNYVEQHQ
jgi:hypothetical protein